MPAQHPPQRFESAEEDFLALVRMQRGAARQAPRLRLAQRDHQLAPKPQGTASPLNNVSRHELIFAR
ncbi:hypothetical protein GCM10025771_20260 [Niveibacterium umoris]